MRERVQIEKRCGQPRRRCKRLQCPGCDLGVAGTAAAMCVRRWLFSLPKRPSVQDRPQPAFFLHTTAYARLFRSRSRNIRSARFQDILPTGHGLYISCSRPESDYGGRFAHAQRMPLPQQSEDTTFRPLLLHHTSCRLLVFAAQPGHRRRSDMLVAVRLFPVRGDMPMNLESFGPDAVIAMTMAALSWSPNRLFQSVDRPLQE